jgi:hypothetical protein
MSVELDHFIGKSFVLTAVATGQIPVANSYAGEHANTLTFVLSGVTYQVVEDPNDGYRSSMREINVLPAVTLTNQFPPVKVVGERVPDDDHYKKDMVVLKRMDNGLPILEFGTHNTHDYYPSFVGDFRVENLPGNEADQIAAREAEDLRLSQMVTEQEQAERDQAGWGKF